MFTISVTINFNRAICFLFAGMVVFNNLASAAGVKDPQSPARVVHLGKSKSGPYAVFDQGSKTGFVIGRDVCFYNKNSEKIHCAAIIRTKSRAAAVTFDEDVRSKIVIGLDVWPEDLGPIKLQPKISDSVADEKTALDIAALSQQEDDPPEPVLPPLLKRRVQFHLAPTFALPIWMNDLRFNSAARSSGTGKIWESGDTIKGSVIGFGVRYHLPLNGRGDSAFDLTYHFVPQKPVKDDFDLTDGSTTVQSEVWSHHYRLRWLRGATWKHEENSDFLLYTGVGYDFLQAKFRSAKVGGSTDELASGTITGHGIEIPVVIAWQKHMGGWMLTTGADMALPVGVFGVKSKGKLGYADDTGTADKSLTSAVNAVNVRRGWFSLALQIGLGAQF